MSSDFSADEFINTLINEGKNIPCDTGNAADIEPDIPPWFDEEKFKRGQDYYHANIFGMFTANICGLLALIGVPSIMSVLIHTGKSSTPLTAYRRYVATVMHTMMWYDNKMQRGSSAWSSLSLIRRGHLHNSQSSFKHGSGFISQKDMALAQFGFMGFILNRPHMLGIKSDSREDREAFVHLWRTIGYMLGMDDRYNICRKSLEETESICEHIISKVIIPAMATDSKDYLKMTRALIIGMSTFYPTLDYGAFMYFTKRIIGLHNYKYLQSDFDNNKVQSNNNKGTFNNNRLTNKAQSVYSEEYESLSWYSKYVLWSMINCYTFWMNNYYAKIFFNSTINVALFFSKYFPYIGYIKYGFKEARVHIHIK